MSFIRLTDQVHVAPQISLEQLDEAKEQGFDAVTSNRPDGEEPGLPSAEEFAARAEELGLRFVHIPIRSGDFHEAAVEEFRMLRESSQKLLAFCRTGTRSSVLWALSMRGDMPPEEIMRRAREAGYELEALRPQLE